MKCLSNSVVNFKVRRSIEAKNIRRFDSLYGPSGSARRALPPPGRGLLTLVHFSAQPEQSLSLTG
jgi:hypothetical protein